MTRQPPLHSSKDQLQEMSLEQLNAYIRTLRRVTNLCRNGWFLWRTDSLLPRQYNVPEPVALTIGDIIYSQAPGIV